MVSPNARHRSSFSEFDRSIPIRRFVAYLRASL